MQISSPCAENLNEVSDRDRESAFLKHLEDSGAGSLGATLGEMWLNSWSGKLTWASTLPSLPRALSKGE